ncbi:LysR family transcriptional regulator [Chromobacterium sp. LK1]|uniref:LysR substrate-binding domain-containing protein n=1 Tax=Chromobacterium sp. LK1 TaxID=1628193 RepID=UPI00065309FC|nr:LysR substrate-binding domain-containing protein [Chromobacterium sp. LK1]KMN32290.1 LysR family transcriptional regulator [Chromobacterium sp. LK1]
MPKPPLESLRFFEAAARRLSVKLAAEELHVTPGAVSQQLRKLEDCLGQPLFERHARGLALNTAGRDYLAACQRALAEIDRATARLIAARRVILLSCTPSFGAQWLIPRLQDFLRAHPRIDVHVSTGNRVVDLATENIHFAVRHGLGHYPGLSASKLLDDELVPVCAPTLPARLDALSGERLLHDEHRGDWRLWSRAAGLDTLDCEQGVVCVDSNAAIEAALAGRGYALARRSLLQIELAAGRLRPLPAPPLPSALAYYLIHRPDTVRDPEMGIFKQWLLEQAAATQNKSPPSGGLET